MKLILKNKYFLIILITSVWSSTNTVQAQFYQSKINTISLFAEAPIEDIKGSSNKAIAYINIETGEIKTHVLIKSFEFGSSLMQSHFSEDCMESNHYPYAIFKGQFTDIEKLRRMENGEYIIKGELNMHGVTKLLEENISIAWIKNDLHAQTKFLVKLSDYEITIPRIIAKNIAEAIEVKVTFDLRKVNELKCFI